MVEVERIRSYSTLAPVSLWERGFGERAFRQSRKLPRLSASQSTAPCKSARGHHRFSRPTSSVRNARHSPLKDSAPSQTAQVRLDSCDRGKSPNHPLLPSIRQNQLTI